MPKKGKIQLNDDNQSADGFTIVATKKKQKEKTADKPKQTLRQEFDLPSVTPRTELADNEPDEIDDIPIQTATTEKYVPPLLNRQRSRVETRPHQLVSTTPLLEPYDPSVEDDRNGNSMELSSTWTAWIHENTNENWNVESYDPIYKISNIGEMWRFLNVFGHLNNATYQYFIMRDGITPIWEDNNNREGCICSIMLECTNRNLKHIYNDICVDAFIAICCLVFNGSFVSNSSDINGLCYSSKQRNVLIKLWVKKYQENKNFIDKLPITLLNTISDVIDNECKGHSLQKTTGSRISVQIKQIVPVY